MNLYDLIIIGAGPGGYQLAAEAVRKGEKVLLIEKDLPGGTCLNRGCIPTKCLLASAEAAHSVASAQEFGVEVSGEVAMRFDVASARMRKVVDQLRQSVKSIVAGADYLEGEAMLSLDADKKPIVRVGDGCYSAQKIVIATGSRPASLPIPGAEYALTSDDLLALDTLPASAVIIGAGVIGMEFACILQAFGVQVTVVEYCSEILPPFDAEVAKRLRTTLGRRGIKIVVGAAVKSIGLDPEGYVDVTYAGKKGDDTIKAQAAIMAVGRKPAVPCGASDIGIVLDKRGAIVVDDGMATSVPGVYAIGDVNGRCMLAHAAEAQARVVTGEDVDLKTIPSAVFSIPECAMVGPTEKQCAEQGIDFTTGKAMYAGNGKALSMGRGEGFVKVIFDRPTHRLLAVHAIGAHAVDIVAEASACITMGATIEDVAIRMVHGHPTVSEMLPAACVAAMSRK